MRDIRKQPYCWQSLPATAAIRRSCGGSELTHALAVYASLTWAANEQRHNEEIAMSRRDLADLAGVSLRQLDRVVDRLEGLGLVARGGGKLTGKPNTWALVEPGQEVRTPVSPPKPGSLTRSASAAQEVRSTGLPPTTRTRERPRREESPPSPPRGKRAKDREAFNDDCERYGRLHFADLGDQAGRAVAQAIGNSVTSHAAIEIFIDRWWRRRGKGEAA